MLNVRSLWDIPGDMSRKQMARSVGLNPGKRSGADSSESYRVEHQTRPDEWTGAQREDRQTPGEGKREEPMGGGAQRRK